MSQYVASVVEKLSLELADLEVLYIQISLVSLISKTVKSIFKIQSSILKIELSTKSLYKVSHI